MSEPENDNEDEQEDGIPIEESPWHDRFDLLRKVMKRKEDRLAFYRSLEPVDLFNRICWFLEDGIIAILRLWPEVATIIPRHVLMEAMNRAIEKVARLEGPPATKEPDSEARVTKKRKGKPTQPKKPKKRGGPKTE